MREIKFRAWNPEIMKMSIGGLKDFDWTTVEVFNHKSGIPVMQYTGLLDKNGMEIYEGDLLKIRQIKRPFEVVWQDDAAYFRAKILDSDTGYAFSVLDISECEVIGNIYEHGHLLEQTK